MDAVPIPASRAPARRHAYEYRVPGFSEAWLSPSPQAEKKIPDSDIPTRASRSTRRLDAVPNPASRPRSGGATTSGALREPASAPIKNDPRYPDAPYLRDRRPDATSDGLENPGFDEVPKMFVLAFIALTTPAVLPPSSQEVYSADFEQPVGSEWSDPSIDVTPVGGRHFLGQFGPTSVTLSLGVGSPIYPKGLPHHVSITTSFDLFVLSNWDAAGHSGGPDVWELSIIGGPTLLHATFSNTELFGGENVFQSYPGNYPGAVYPAGTGASEEDTLGLGDSFWGPGSRVYRLCYSLGHTADSLTIRFSGLGLTDEYWGLDNVQVTIADTEAIGAAYCFGDGSGTPCPCGNYGASCEGCKHSLGIGARLFGEGSTSIGVDDLVLTTIQMPLNKFGLTYMGSMQTGGGSGQIFGDGLRCVRGELRRFSIQHSGSSGTFSLTSPVAQSSGLIAAGTTWNFQAWFRDNAASPCGTQYNLSNGLSVSFTP